MNNWLPWVVALPLSAAFLIPLTARLGREWMADALGNAVMLALVMLSVGSVGQSLVYHVGDWTTPLGVKKELDAALLAAKVRYLLGCYATDVLRDAEGKPAGIAMANRAGRQAVTAKVMIDATDRAWVARRAGARAQPWPAGKQVFTYDIYVKP